MPVKKRERYFFYALFGVVAVVCLAIFWPFLTVLLLGASLAVVLHPLFLWVSKHLTAGITWLAALVTVFIFIVLLALPLFLIGSRVYMESQALYASLSAGGANEYIAAMTTSLRSILPHSAVVNLQSKLGDIVSVLSGTVATVFTSTLQTIFSFFLAVLALFYFLKDGDRWRRYLIELSPLSDVHDERILVMLARAVNGVMKGYILIALVQGLLMGLGLWIFGVPNAVLWGVLSGIASMIPSIGTALVSIPAVAYLLLTGDSVHAIGLGVWALALVGGIDNFLNPLIVGKNIELPPLLILFAVLGGIALMGAAGIVIGPLAVSLFYTLTSIYKEDFR
jgi:predicted PurR-regulated permease PerM